MRRRLHGPAAPSRQAVAGFSLIELMVASLIGLIVLLGVVTLAIGQMRSSTEQTEALRLTQDLRLSQALIFRELKRSGFNRNAVTMVSSKANYSASYAGLTFGGSTPTAASDCAQVVATGAATANTCVLFAYDMVGVNDGVATPNGLEQRGFRRLVAADGHGLLQAFMTTNSAATPACGDAIDNVNWVTLTLPGDNITGFKLVNNPSAAISVAAIPGATLNVRDVAIQIDGTPFWGNSIPTAGTPSIQRRLCGSVMLRTDFMNAP